jgi:hypothetical protein
MAENFRPALFQSDMFLSAGLEPENKAVGIRRADHAIPSIRKIWH